GVGVAVVQFVHRWHSESGAGRRPRSSARHARCPPKEPLERRAAMALSCAARTTGRHAVTPGDPRMLRRDLWTILVLLAAAAVGCDGADPAIDGPPPGVATAALEGDANEPEPIVAPGADTASLTTNTSRYWQLTVPPSHD